MSVGDQKDGIPRYTGIGKGLYLSLAQSSESGRNTESQEQPTPTLILIFGWMGAKLPHLRKYTAVYEERFPGATKILIQCEASFFWSRESTRQANLAPVVEVLRSLGYISPRPQVDSGTSSMSLLGPRVLVHAFSNGGCSQLLCLGRILEKKMAKTTPSPALASAIIFDSCPGIGNLESSKRAFTGLIRNPIIRAIGNFIMTVIYIYSKLMKRLFAKKDMAQVLRAALHNPRLLPWVCKYTPRLYIYSRKDELVPFTEVEKHAQEAEVAGFNVMQEKFEDTAHVAHARTEPERYWGAVDRVWFEACKKEEARSE
ncbi:hypothetical protein BDZ94DRAFT_1169921 [Collybia nuda]|uniref:Transmembrane protein 53 n=1 Tax=Collybia nuda TaxID=64659 RepID=A0A9P5Y353_9AGAR|nr:hypothetical protein BDZ94DRAFT_1169921 [Collybia nuda]